MAHYTWYNLTTQSKQTTSVVFQVVGYAIEAFVFGYLGLTCFAYNDYDWSWELIVAEGIIIVLGRFMGTIGVIKICELFGYKSGLRLKDLVFISYAGMIRGSVAFGLVLRIDHSVINRPVIVTTSLFLVNTTTIVLGSTVATAQKFLFGKEMTAKKEAEAMAKGLLEKSPHNKSEVQEFHHPNLDISAGTPQPMIEP